VTWAALGPAARAFRIAHTVWSIVSLASLANIWACAFTRQRNRMLGPGIAFLGVEGLALVVGRGDCPFGPLQRRLGDPVPLFELVLPPRAAKAAVPLLAAVTLAGLLVLVIRRPTEASNPQAGRPLSPQPAPDRVLAG
jgi:hypothetical protein